ncbi:MAG: protein translocase subunit SecF [Anaerolineae bacterium]|nr:protein translocase subunit SecF [Anaerolineae bacterium]
MFNLVQYRRWFYLFSGLIILAGIIAMGISISQYPERSIVRLGIDFTGGSLFEVRLTNTEGATQTPIEGSDISKQFTDAGMQDVRVQRIVGTDASQDRFQVRTNFVAQNGELFKQISDKINTLATEHGYNFDAAYFQTNQQSVSPAIGGEVTIAAVIATAAASLLVLGFIALAFRQVTHSFRYGSTAVIAMIHDVLVMVGVFSILGLILGWEADALFLTGLLTVVGYSVQDTIVVFDRIRENSQRHRGEPFELIVNRSVTETIQRSITTQICVAFVLLALVLMGSGAIRQFVGILLIGLLSGAYSSIGIAIPLLVSWERGEIPFLNQGAKAKTA